MWEMAAAHADLVPHHAGPRSFSWRFPRPARSPPTSRTGLPPVLLQPRPADGAAARLGRPRLDLKSPWSHIRVKHSIKTFRLCTLSKQINMPLRALHTCPQDLQLTKSGTIASGCQKLAGRCVVDEIDSGEAQGAVCWWGTSQSDWGKQKPVLASEADGINHFLNSFDCVTFAEPLDADCGCRDITFRNQSDGRVQARRLRKIVLNITLLHCAILGSRCHIALGGFD
mmetsp:Transcript_48982/g.106659  ORF Transcript_48982/g.106659 Transcript_48982/m.106659 type:complete len:227 (+) Transcript_48982:337-1017(+)